MKTKSKKNVKKTRRMKKSHTKTRKHIKKGGDANTTSEPPKKYGSLTSGIKTAVMQSTKAYNMPAILGAMSSKINALLVNNKVNYQFSNGYNARDYDIINNPGNQENDGRGALKPNAKRGVITGVQSKIYNIGYDKYKDVKKNIPPKQTTQPVVKTSTVSKPNTIPKQNI